MEGSSDSSSCTDRVELLNLCRRMPKVELHAHISGSVGNDALRSLVQQRLQREQQQQQQQQQPHAAADHAFSQADADVLLEAAGSSSTAAPAADNAGCRRSMHEVFKMFDLLHAVIDSPMAAAAACQSALADFANDGALYTELRTTLREFPAHSATAADHLETVLAAVAAAPISAGLLVSIDRQRGVAAAMSTLELACAARAGRWGDYVLGIDFCGNPSMNNAADFIPVFDEARKRGLPITLHLAELQQCQLETQQVLNSFTPERIGHATYLHKQHPVLANQLIRDHASCCIELCLSSNLCTSTVDSVQQHQFGFWFQNNHPVAICTDDKFVFNTSLSAEFALAAAEFNISDRRQLFTISRNSLLHSFAPRHVKQQLLRDFDLWFLNEFGSEFSSE